MKLNEDKNEQDVIRNRNDQDLEDILKEEIKQEELNNARDMEAEVEND